jgi:tetratricopeptide (TPR) repeat protein
MKKIISMLLLTFYFTGCSNNIETLQIPLTSNSEEAKVLFTNKILTSNSDNQLFGPSVINAMNQILKLDPNFYLAKAINARYLQTFNLGANEVNKIITEAFENKDSVSEIENAIISSIYHEYVLGNLVKGDGLLQEIVGKYPSYYYLWIYHGNYQNTILLNPKKSEGSWQKALEINPVSAKAKVLLAQLHFVTGQINILSNNERDEDLAISLIEDAEKTDSKNNVYSRLLGNIYRARGEYDVSLSSYNRAMSLIKDKEGDGMGGLLLISGHNYLFKKEYEKARELYRASNELNKDLFLQYILTYRWLAHTYIYEKKYNEAINEINDLEKRIVDEMNLDELSLNYYLGQLDFERFLSFGHSQMKEDANESILNFSNHLDKQKSLRVNDDTPEDEIRRISLDIDIQKEFHKIWYLILFGEFEEAAQELKSFSLLSSEYLVYDSKAMINFYKLSGYLNLMSGNIDASISFYDQIPREVLDSDNYQLYFYALALSTKGNKEKSEEVFKYLANYNFAGWENSIIRPLAQAQLEKI